MVDHRSGDAPSAYRSPASGPVTLSDRWRGLRDRILTAPGFIAWAARFPLTRPIARNRARAVFDLCAGFVYSQILLACVRLDLFKTLRAGPLTADQLADKTGLPRDGLDRLLKGAIALDLLDRRGGGRYGLGATGAAILGNPGLEPMIEHHAVLYGDLTDPVALFAGTAQPTALSRYWAYARAEDPTQLVAPDVTAYSAVMAASQAFIARDVIEAYPFKTHRHLLDVGGGEGRFAVAAASAAPDLKVTVFDLPAVAERARTRLEAEGLGNRAGAVGGSFFHDPLPRSADLATLVRVLHDHDDPAALAILRAVHRALPDNGTLLIAEPMAGTPGAAPMGDAYFGVYLLAMGSGRPRTPDEIRGLLETAGFTDIGSVATPVPLLVQVIKARKTGNSPV